jgi:hypothetical protein
VATYSVGVGQHIRQHEYTYACSKAEVKLHPVHQMEVRGHFQATQLHPTEKNPRTRWIGRWVNPVPVGQEAGRTRNPLDRRLGEPDTRWTGHWVNPVPVG